MSDHTYKLRISAAYFLLVYYVMAKLRLAVSYSKIWQGSVGENIICKGSNFRLQGLTRWPHNSCLVVPGTTYTVTHSMLRVRKPLLFSHAAYYHNSQYDVFT